MAEKEKEAKVVLERAYNIPLRKGFQKAPRWERTKRAVSVLKTFVAKHMKADINNVKIGKYLNLKLWKHGIKNPPHHIMVECKKDSKGVVIAEVVGAPLEKVKAEKEKKAKLKEEKKEAVTRVEEKEKELEEKLKEIKEEREEKAKEVEKEEIKEIKKEHPTVHSPKETAVSKELHVRKREMIPGR